MTFIKDFTDLGIAGAALFVLVHIINKIFNYLEKRSASEGKSKENKFDKLCEKIDKLVEAFYENMNVSTVVQETMKSQTEVIINKIDNLSTQLTKTFSDLFQAFREHEVHNQRGMADIQNQLETGLDGNYSAINNLKENCERNWRGSNEYSKNKP